MSIIGNIIASEASQVSMGALACSATGDACGGAIGPWYEEICISSVSKKDGYA